MTTQNDKKDESSSNIETTSDSAKEGAAMTMDSADIETPSPPTPTMTIQLTLTALPGAPRIPLDLPMMNNDKVVLTSSELRQLVSTKTSIPLSALRLIYRGRLITDQATDTTTNVITEYKLENGSVLHCMGKPSTTTATKQETSSSTTTGSSETSVANATVSTPTTATPVTTAPATTSTASASSSFSSSSVPSLQSALDAMRASNSLTVYAKCIKTLQKVLLNIIDHPLEEKYRTIKVNNAAFQKHFHHVHNSTTVLLACGFQLIHWDDAERAAYTMNASPAQWPTLLQSKATIDRAVQQSALTVTPSIAPAATGPGTARPYSSSSSSSPSPFPFPPAGGMMPDPSVLQEHIANVMSNPQQIQAMMQNPMIQNMIRNDPQLANIPHLQQAMDEMMNNPQVAEGMRQMMSDPNYQRMLSSPEYIQSMQQRVQQSLSGARVSDPPPLFPPNIFTQPPPPPVQQPPASSPWGTATAAPTNNATATTPASTTRSDDELTEEEMIAEAIRRSLQDNSNNGP